MGEFDGKIEELESRINKLKEEKLALEMLDIERQNAVMLHEKFCTQNHVDMCGWFREIKDGTVNWEGPVHKNWFQKAERLIRSGYRISDVVKIKDLIGLKMEDTE